MGKNILEDLPRVNWISWDYDFNDIKDIMKRVSIIKKKWWKIECGICKWRWWFTSCCQKPYSNFCCWDYSSFWKCSFCDEWYISLDDIIIYYMQEYNATNDCRNDLIYDTIS